MKAQNDTHMSTGLGIFSKKKFNALIDIRSSALAAVREILSGAGYTEVTTSSLVNIAGSCENPYASFKLNYYGRDAHLSQSAQLQLEALVIRLKRGVFTINNSFREENYDDPEAKGRRLSEFTLIEPERPYKQTKPEDALRDLIRFEEKIIKHVVRTILKNNRAEIRILGGDVKYLESIVHRKFKVLTYDEALALLNVGGRSYRFGDDLEISEERQLLAHFNNTPTFVTHFPAKIKFFNMKRTPDGTRTYSVDLLTPHLGETIGGAIREESGLLIKKYLRGSKIAKFIREHGGDPLEPFTEYLRLFEQEKPTLRGGFGIGFERLIGFLIGSNDILNTIAARVTTP